MNFRKIFALGLLTFSLFLAAACTKEVVVVKSISDDVTVYVNETIDFKSLFTIKVNDLEVEVSLDMIDLSKVDLTKAGEYDVTLNYKKVAVTVKIKVLDKVIVSKTSVNNEFYVNASFDYKTLFSITLNGTNVVVTDSMIDSSLVNKAVPGTYDVSLKFTQGGKDFTLVSNVLVKAIPLDTIVLDVTTGDKDFNIGDSIDYTTFFTITRNGVNVPVTLDMIDYSDVLTEAGVYEVILSYGGQTKVTTVRISNPLDSMSKALLASFENYSVVFSGSLNYEIVINASKDFINVKVVKNDITIYYTYDMELKQAYALTLKDNVWVKNTVKTENIRYYFDLFLILNIDMFEFKDDNFKIKKDDLSTVFANLVNIDATADSITFVLDNSEITSVDIIYNTDKNLTLTIKDVNASNFELPSATMTDLVDRLPNLKDCNATGDVTEAALLAGLAGNFNNVKADVSILWQNSAQENETNFNYSYFDDKSGKSIVEGSEYKYTKDPISNQYAVLYSLNGMSGHDFYSVSELVQYALRINFNQINSINKAYFKVEGNYYVAKDIKLFSSAFTKFFAELMVYYINEDYSKMPEFTIDDFAMKIVDNKIVYVGGRLKYQSAEMQDAEYYTIKINFSDYQTVEKEEIDLSVIPYIDKVFANAQLNPNYSINYSYDVNGVKTVIKIHYFNEAVMFEYANGTKYAITNEPVYYLEYLLGYQIRLYKAVNNFWEDQYVEVNNLNELGLPNILINYLYETSENNYEYISDYFTKETETSYVATENLDTIGNFLFGNTISTISPTDLVALEVGDIIKIEIITTTLHKIEKIIVTLKDNKSLTLTFGTVIEFIYPQHNFNINGELHDLGVEGNGSANVDDINKAVENLTNYDVQYSLTAKNETTYQRDVYEYSISKNGVFNKIDGFYYNYLPAYNAYFGYDSNYEVYDYFTKKQLIDFGALYEINLAVLDKANFVANPDGYFRAKDGFGAKIVQAIFGDLTANGAFTVTIKDFVVKVVDGKLSYIGAEISRQKNGKAPESYILEYIFTNHGAVNLSELEGLCNEQVANYPLEAALVKLADYIFKAELSVTKNGKTEKVVLAYSENYTKYTFADGTEYYVEYLGAAGYAVYSKTDTGWTVSEVESLKEVKLPEIFYLSHMVPDGDSYAYIVDYFAKGENNAYVCGAETAYYFALFFMLHYTVFENQLVEFANEDFTKFSYILDGNNQLSEAIILAGGYTLSYKFFTSSKFELPNLFSAPVIVDDYDGVGSQDVTDVTAALEAGFNNYGVNVKYEILNAKNGESYSQATYYRTDDQKFSMTFVGYDEKTYTSYYLYKGDFLADQYDKDENGNWIVNKDQDISQAINYGLIDYIYFSILKNYTLMPKDGYFTVENPIKAFCDMFGFDEKIFSKAIDFRIKVIGQRIVKIMAVMETMDGSYLAYDVSFDEYEEVKIDLPTDLDFAYTEFANQQKYVSTVVVDLNGVKEEVIVEYANGKYKFIVGSEAIGFYDSATDKLYVSFYGQWQEVSKGYSTLADKLAIAVLSIPKKFEEGWIDPVEVLTSSLFTQDVNNKNLYSANANQKEYVINMFLAEGLAFGYRGIDISALEYKEVLIELKDGKIYQIIIKIGDYSITATFNNFDGEVILPGSEQPVDPENPDTPKLDDLTAGMLTSAFANPINSYTMEYTFTDAYGTMTSTYYFCGNLIKVVDPMYDNIVIIDFNVSGDSSQVYTFANGVWTVATKSHISLSYQYFLGVDFTLISEADYTIDGKYFASNEMGLSKITGFFQFFYLSENQIKIGLNNGILAEIILVTADNKGVITYSNVNSTIVEVPTV